MWKNDPQTGEKHGGKRRNRSLRAISPFLTVFSKDLYCGHVKNQGLFGKCLLEGKIWPMFNCKTFGDDNVKWCKFSLTG